MALHVLPSELLWLSSSSQGGRSENRELLNQQSGSTADSDDDGTSDTTYSMSVCLMWYSCSVISSHTPLLYFFVGLCVYVLHTCNIIGDTELCVTIFCVQVWTGSMYEEVSECFALYWR